MFWVILAVLCLNAEGWPNSKSEPMDSGLEQQPIYWYEREVRKRAWMALDEVAVFPKKGEGAKLNRDLFIQHLHPRAVIGQRNNLLIYLKTPERMERKAILERICSLRGLDGVRQASPVFYTDKKRHPATRLVLTGEIIVQFPNEFPESKIATIEKQYGLERLKPFPFTQNTFLYLAGEPLLSLKVANDLYQSGQVNYAYPNWLRSRSKRAVPDDPFFFEQWYLNNTGQGGGTAGEDVNITSVWDTYRASSSEVVAIVDDGLEIGHEDLSDNLLDGESYDYVDGDTDPTAGDHGTSCAGVAAARGFNGQGITGAAPSAGLVGHRLLGPGAVATDANEADALTRNNGLIDIYSNSWGPLDNGQRLEGPGPLTESALEWGVANGRGGLGSIYVWAGGNGYDYDNANYDGYANSRHTITVAASTNFGVRSSYSEKGANILVNAPSNGGSLGITTTDRTGIDGYDPGDYTSNFGGTSSATPLVSGIIALMLQANPNLTWRDVQHILIATAEHNDLGDTDWTLNGTGYRINHKYGFGRIDAQAAVNAALTWTSAGVEAKVWGSSAPDLLIPDNNPTGVSDTISISYDISAEFVEVYFTAAHSYWGDLEITLTSPEGTESILAEAHISGNGSYDNWRFGSVRHFGESSRGDWTLKVKDLQAGDVGTLESWTVKIYGTGGVPPEAHAGPDQEVAEGTEVTLDGSGSTDPDDFIVSYRWIQLSGPTVTLSDASSAKPTFTAPNVSPPGESLTFQLTVTDNFDLHSTDTCIVDVTGVNDPPTANAGPDQTVTKGTEVTLNGSNSADPDDGIASYLWEKTGGPAVTLSGISSAKPTFTAPDVEPDGESLTFRLTVADNGGLESVDTCIVNVTWVQDPSAKKGGSGGGGGGPCFIATAAYGSPMEPQVKILREFRDRCLLTNSPGRNLVNLYYTYSPPLADFIANHNRLRAVVRCCLTPIVGVSYVALHIGPITAIALMVLIFACKVWWGWHHRSGRMNTFSKRKHHLYSWCPSRNGGFCPETRPHKGFYRRRSSATSRIETRGERSIGAKDAVSGWTLV